MINIFCLIYNNKDFLHDLYANHKDDNIPIYIFDNNSNDGLSEVINLYADKFKYINLGPKTGIDKTITQVFKYSTSRYIWLFGDDRIYKNKINIIKEKIDNHNPDIVLLNSDIQKKGNIYKRKINIFNENTILIKSKDEFISYLSNSIGIYNLFSFISSIIIKKEVWDKISNEKKLFKTNYHHSYKILKLIEKGSKLLIFNERAITPTLDSEGRYTSLEPVSHNPSNRIHHIKKYIGSYQQKIPNFSAHKKEGKNFYQLARNNETIEERYKQVAISSLKILYSKPTTLGIELECQTGFYVRAFAEELSSSLGDLGYASYIKRLNIGDFSMNRSVAYEKILDFSSIDDLSNHLITI